MRTDKRTILALVAAGRISAADAERLVRAWNEPAQWLLAAIVCLMLALGPLHLPASAAGAHWLHQRARHAMDVWNTAARLLIEGKEGQV